MKMKMVVSRITEHDIHLKPLSGAKVDEKTVAHRAWAKGTWIQTHVPVPKPNVGEVWEVEVNHFGLCRYSKVPMYIAKPIEFLSADWRRYVGILPTMRH